VDRWWPAYVAIGSNLGDPESRVREALERLAQLPTTLRLAQSRLWTSPPLGPQDQPDFVNAVAGLLTRLPPAGLLAGLKEIEAAMGKTPPAVRWGPRRIDLDLLAYAAQAVDAPGLRLPHPGLHQRDFVLYPLAEVAPQMWIPGRGRVATLAAEVGNRGAVALGG